MPKLASTIVSTRYILARKSTFILFVVISIATIVRPLLIELPVELTYIGIFNSLVVGTIYSLMRFAQPNILYVHLFLCSMFLCTVPLLMITGGVNSQFTVLLPMFAAISSLIAGSKPAIGVSVATVVTILLIRLVDLDIGGIYEFEYNPQVQNARTFWLVMTVFLTLYISLQFNKLSDKLSKKLVKQANIDALTGVPNRRYILEHLESTLLHPKTSKSFVSVLMVDVDHFKRLNDQYGHLFGDECLKKIATTLKNSIRFESDVVGRYGGEEFLVVLNNVDATRTAEIAEKIRFEISLIQCKYHERNVSLTVTIGCCSMLVSMADSTEQLIGLADKALYQGKAQGRNCIVTN